MNTPVLSSLLDMKAGSQKKPKVLPPGDYLGIIKAHTTLDAPADKEYKKIIRLSLGLVDWPEGLDQEDMMQDGPNGPEVIKLASRSLRRDYYDHRLFDLDQLATDCGIDISELSYRELLQELIGKQVYVEVAQYVNQRTGEFGNQVNNLRGIS